MAETFDLIIRGGTILDGSGDSAFVGDVAISGNRISAVGAVQGSAKTEIDATGRIVTPGFVDVHTHFDGQVTWENRLEPSSRHGCTTVVMGNCGVGFAPARPHQRDLMIRLMEGVEDVPEVVMAEGIPWAWETFADYLDFLDDRPCDADFAAQLPHSPLRVYIMGERALGDSLATDADLGEFRRLTTQALDAGAVGVSTSRSHNHRFPGGDLAPSVFRNATPELLAMADGMRDAGKGVFQLQSNRDEPAASEYRLMREIMARSGRPLSFTLIPEPSGDWLDYLKGLHTAMDEGLAMRGQFLPRPPGVLLGLDLSNHMFSLMPSYQAIADLPLADKVKAMRDPQLRARLLSEEPVITQPNVAKFTQAIHPLFVLGNPPNYLPRVEDSFRNRAAATGRDVKDLIYDALLDDDGRAILYLATGNHMNEDFAYAGQVLGDSGIVLGLGDGGAHYGIVCDGAFPTFFLESWVKDQGRAGRIGLPDAIRMLSRETARLAGFFDRGLLKPGYKADLNVIDLDRLHLHAPRMVADLPANGRRLRQSADGYDATIVSGVVTYRNGEATGALPGRLVRGAQPAPVGLAA